VGLAHEFLAEFAAAGGEPFAFDASHDELEVRLAALLARAAAAHPSLVVAEEDFAAHLARAAARLPADGPPLEGLAIEDLYLARACVGRAAGAAEAFDVRCGARLRAAVAGATKSQDEAREMEQRLRDLVLVGDATEPPRLASYGGQGPLDRWVTVVAQRQIVNAIRSEQAERRAREAAAKEAAVLEAALHPELAFLKERYKAAFEAAMAAGLAKLDDRQRVVLKLHLVSGASVVQIGQMYGVNHSTISRWLADARDSVSSEARRHIREHAGLNPSELHSLAVLVASQLEVSMSRLLS
jgi:RNA polymerase sigma-70 factor (ECF subfamily)